MITATDTIDVTKAEGEIIVTYCLGRIKRDRHCNPLLDDVVYWRAEWMRPQPDACKRNAYENYRLALEAWRDERTNSMTTTPQPAPQKSAAHLAVESLQTRVDNLAHEQHDANENFLKAINELRSDIGTLQVLLVSMSETIRHLTVQPTSPAPVAPTAPSAPASTQGGTFHIVKMTVLPRTDGKVELAFFEAGHQYADIKAVKTPPECAALLKTIGDWKPEHFSKAGEYPVTCVIDWTPSANLNKSGKPYKNIVAVKPANA